MKRLLVTVLLSGAIAAPAFASDISKGNVGVGYGFDNGGVLSVHGDFDISNMVDKQPVMARVGFDHYSLDYNFGGSYSWSYNVFYGGAYYDFNKVLKLDHRIHPFAGLGIGFGTTSCSGSSCAGAPSPTVGGLYYILGAQYDVTPKIAAELNFNGWGGLSLGANFKF